VTHGGLGPTSEGTAGAQPEGVDDAHELAIVRRLPSEVVFTSGGTEADNLAVLGSVGAGAPREGAALLCSAIEHPAVRMPAGRLGGIEVAVDGHGLLDLDALAKACTPDVALVSVILVNNEVGTIANLDAIAEVVRRHAPTAWLHTDAVGPPWVAWLAACSADLVSVGACLAVLKGIGPSAG
jgi:cysteine desulfurase